MLIIMLVTFNVTTFLINFTITVIIDPVITDLFSGGVYRIICVITVRITANAAFNGK